MKLHFTVILILIINAAWAQMNTSWDIIAGVDYSYRYITVSDNSSYLNFVKGRNNSERGKLNWRIGINYNKRLVKKTFFKTGLRLASVGHVLLIDSLATGVPEPNFPTNAKIYYDYWFLEIPLIFRFEKEKNTKFSTFWELGVSPYLYLSSLEYRKFDDDKSLRFVRAGARSGRISFLQIVGSIAFGVNYNYSDKVQLFTQPNFRFHLTQLSKGEVREHLYNAGLEMGVRWRH